MICFIYLFFQFQANGRPSGWPVQSMIFVIIALGGTAKSHSKIAIANGVIVMRYILSSHPVNSAVLMLSSLCRGVANASEF